jgi:hypothetical protein
LQKSHRFAQFGCCDTGVASTQTRQTQSIGDDARHNVRFVDGLPTKKGAACIRRRQAVRSVGESNKVPDSEAGKRRSGTRQCMFPWQFAAFAQVLGIKPKQ